MERITLKMNKKILNKSITRRWLLNTLGIIVLIIIAVNIGFAFVVHTYLYGLTKQMLVTSAITNDNLVKSSASDNKKNIPNEIRNIVKNYADKNKIELMLIDFNNEIADTSSGFSAKSENNPKDYKDALESEDGTGYYIGTLKSGDKIMAYTKLIETTNNQYTAFRYVVSLKQIDTLILELVLIFIAISAIVLIFVVISGNFFISSIIHPIQEINTAVHRIASGDLKVRIHSHTQDELGELCIAINEMADELSNAERLKNEFISSVSHELRTPLTAIQGWSETIVNSNKEDNKTIKKGVSIISKETERLSNMVEDLLDFSRIQNGRFTLKKDRMDILAELEEAVLMYTEKAKTEEKLLIYEETEILPIIYGDKNRIKQVFINIIDNAIKYSDAGDKIRIHTNISENNETVHITITDTGCGISEKDLPMIKKKFYKANHTRHGSGIGLAVCDEIINMHDGKLLIESTEGKGTKVTIILPIDHCTEETPSMPHIKDEPYHESL